MLLRMTNGALQKLFDLIATLRGADGCPWDQEQTAENILSDLVEEVYELQWAHAHGDAEETRDELGDVVFVLTFAIALLQERDPSLTMEAVTQQAYDKIYRRHPHVFGNAEANTKKEGLAHWERMKAEERASKPAVTGTFEDIPKGLPPLRRAEKIHRRASSTGFDWDDVTGVISKIREELSEVEAALAANQRDKVEEEVGDLLFSLVNLSRFIDVDADKALTATNAKFIKRYESMRQLATDDGKDFAQMTLEQMDAYWEKAKRQ